MYLSWLHKGDEGVSGTKLSERMVIVTMLISYICDY